MSRFAKPAERVTRSDNARAKARLHSLPLTEPTEEEVVVVGEVPAVDWEAV